ncbi:UBC-like protein [Mycena alexandri]|uniref:UBC-like protein n=1 Tax=Mycena alexandri TaxID=1745969 RepID=A0AAD6TM60_9AGAR|nr:UBC-like protein [Mycena alexandri]
MLVSLVPPSMDFGAARPKPPPKKAVPDSIDPVTRTTISLEYASLQHRDHCPLGMLLRSTLMVWDAVFFVHQGYYADAILKFRLTFPNNYPESPPTVQFVAEDVVFHPLVSHSGIFNLAPRFRPWRPKEHRVFDVLHWIKAAFKKHALDEIRESDCLNKEAYRYHESTSSFASLATQSSLLSQSAPALFDRDHPSLKGQPRDAMPFRELAPDQLQLGRTKLGLKEWLEKPEKN